MYTSSLPPLARSIYSNWWSSNTLKNWYPCITWLSAGESTKARIALSYSSAPVNVDASTLPSVSQIQRSTRVIPFNPSMFVWSIWFEIIFLSPFLLSSVQLCFRVFQPVIPQTRLLPLRQSVPVDHNRSPSESWTDLSLYFKAKWRKKKEGGRKKVNFFVILPSHAGIFTDWNLFFRRNFPNMRFILILLRSLPSPSGRPSEV